jgi:DNA repair protein RecO (recombination protein O)
LDSTPAILLRKTRFSDTSLILTWFTPEQGKIKTIAKGALRPKSRFAGVLDLFFECEISIARSPRTDLHTLREAVLRDPRENLRKEYPRVALAAYFVELLELTTEPDHGVPELFDLLQRALQHLNDKPASRRALLHFELELARLLGIQNPSVTPIVALGRAYHRVPSARPGLVKTLGD